MSHVMDANGILSCVIAFVFVAAAVPLVRKVALRLNLFDPPGPLKIHTEPIARLGGVAMTLGLLVAVLSGSWGAAGLLPFLASLMIVWLVGIWDDVSDLSPGFRLVAQFASAVLLVEAGWGGDFGGGRIAYRIGACLFIVVLMNAFNFLDGSDGLASGVAAVIALGYALLNGASASSLGGHVAWALLGSCAAFLLSNFPPAKIFMGDCGSTTLGFVIAFLGLDYYSGGDRSNSRLLVPLLFAGLPLVDFGLAILRRFSSGNSVFEGDRRHLYDLLLQRGWSPRRVAVCFYFATSALVASGLLSNSADLRLSELIAQLGN